MVLPGSSVMPGGVNGAMAYSSDVIEPTTAPLAWP